MKDVFLGVLLVIVIVSGYIFIDFNKFIKAENSDVKFTLQSKQCDLHEKPCEIKLENDVSFILEIFPKEIPLMKPLKFKIKTKNYDEETINLFIYATNMQMGTQKIVLNKIKNNEYEAKVILPTCIEGNMIWDTDVVLGKIGAKFKFKTDY